jgi:hypothetical protein
LGNHHFERSQAVNGREARKIPQTHGEAPDGVPHLVEALKYGRWRFRGEVFGEKEKFLFSVIGKPPPEVWVFRNGEEGEVDNQFRKVVVVERCLLGLLALGVLVALKPYAAQCLPHERWHNESVVVDELYPN